MRWRRTPCDHGLLLAELQRLRVENARLTARLATYQILHWMHAAIIRRDRMANAEQAKAVRLRTIAEEPTAVYATEQIRRTR